METTSTFFTLYKPQFETLAAAFAHEVNIATRGMKQAYQSLTALDKNTNAQYCDRCTNAAIGSFIDGEGITIVLCSECEDKRTQGYERVVNLFTARLEFLSSWGREHHAEMFVANTTASNGMMNRAIG